MFETREHQFQCEAFHYENDRKVPSVTVDALNIFLSLVEPFRFAVIRCLVFRMVLTIMIGRPTWMLNGNSPGQNCGLAGFTRKAFFSDRHSICCTCCFRSFGSSSVLLQPAAQKKSWLVVLLYD